MAMTESAEAFTELLRAWGEGDRGALDRMMPLVYDPTPTTPNEGTRFYGGLEVLVSPQPWGPWQTVFSSESQTDS